MKGIANVSGVSCHVTSALQLLFHNIMVVGCSGTITTTTNTTTDLGICLMQFSNIDNNLVDKQDEPELYFLQQLGILLQELVVMVPTEILKNESGSDDDDNNRDNESWTCRTSKDVAVVDPTNFYQALEQQTSIDTFELGDAATALRIILQTIRQCVVKLVQQYENNDSMDRQITTTAATTTTTTNKGDKDLIFLSPSPWEYLRSLLDTCLLGGQIQQELIGYRDNSTPSNTSRMIVGQKVKTKAMTCPYPLQTIDSSTLSSALRKATIEPVEIQGYTWQTHTNDDDDNDDDNDTNTSEIFTQRMSRFVSLPDLFMVHVMRLSYMDGKVNVFTNEMDIPQTLDMIPYTTTTTTAHCDGERTGTSQNNDDHNHKDDDPQASLAKNDLNHCLQYTLTGAILHVQQDKDADDNNDDAENGHYIALVQQQQQDQLNDRQPLWAILDDKDVHVLSSTTSASDILELLSCRRPTATNISIESFMTKNKYTDVVPTVLTYKRLPSSCCRAAPHKRQHNNDTIHNYIENLNKFVAWRRRRYQTIRTIPTKNWIDNPESIVGKRLQIRWAKGKFYAGVVASYNESTGKHCVRYDDGDVKEYLLNKKTIQWDC